MQTRPSIFATLALGAWLGACSGSTETTGNTGPQSGSPADPAAPLANAATAHLVLDRVP